MADTTVEVKTAITFRRIMTPNFVTIETFTSHDPVRENASIPIGKLDEVAIAALAEAWLDDLYAKTVFSNPFTSQLR